MIWLFAPVRMLHFAGPEPRIDREPVLHILVNASRIVEENWSCAAPLLSSSMPAEVITGFFIQLATCRRGCTVVTMTRRHMHALQHRGEHVSFESAQVTGATWAASVGKTKEVALFRELVEADPPVNFWWIYSLGGTQEGLLHR